MAGAATAATFGVNGVEGADAAAGCSDDDEGDDAAAGLLSAFACAAVEGGMAHFVMWRGMTRARDQRVI